MRERERERERECDGEGEVGIKMEGTMKQIVREREIE